METPEKKVISQNSKTYYDFSVCPACKGTGWKVYQISPEGYEGKLADYAEPCPTCKGGLAERTERVKKLSDIPTVFYDKSYDSFNWDIYKDNSGKYIDMSRERKLVESLLRDYQEWRKKGLGLYIHSETKGSGKTFLASCICNELMERHGIRTKFVNATKLLDISQSGDKESPDEYKREPIKLLCNCELLVLDDIGQKKSGNEWMNEVVFRIVDDRMIKNLITLFTSNLNVGQLPLDDRIAERIAKVSYPIKLPEYNVRSREANDEKVRFLKDMGLLKGGE